MTVENLQPVENSGETSKVEYEDLTSLNKVKAILAAVQEPVSQAFALELAGINLVELPEQEKDEILNFFNQRTETSDEEVVYTKDGVLFYQAHGSAKAAIEENTDMRSVNKQIADKLMGDLYGS